MTKANVVTTGALFRKCFIQNTSYYHSPSMPDVSPQIPEVSPTQHLKQARPRAIESFTSSRMPGGRLGGLVTEAGLFAGGRLSSGRKPSGSWVECSSRL